MASIRSLTCLMHAESASVQFRQQIRAHRTVSRPALRYGSGAVAIRFVRTTEGFYDTASLRSQLASQHQTVYQKESRLPKRRCPRRGKPARHNGANKRGKPNDAPTTKPWPCVKNMLCDRCATVDRPFREAQKHENGSRAISRCVFHSWGSQSVDRPSNPRSVASHKGDSRVAARVNREEVDNRWLSHRSR